MHLSCSVLVGALFLRERTFCHTRRTSAGRRVGGVWKLNRRRWRSFGAWIMTLRCWCILLVLVTTEICCQFHVFYQEWMLLVLGQICRGQLLLSNLSGQWAQLLLSDLWGQFLLCYCFSMLFTVRLVNFLSFLFLNLMLNCLSAVAINLFQYLPLSNHSLHFRYALWCRPYHFPQNWTICLHFLILLGARLLPGPQIITGSVFYEQPFNFVVFLFFSATFA